MADVKWIKITTDMFDNRKIKYLRTLPEGNNIVLIWVMLLTIAGRCNASGMIFLTENIPYDYNMLADEIGFDVNTVKLALEALARMNMIIMDENAFAISNWEKYQSTDRLDKIREYQKNYHREYREKQKLLAGNLDGDGKVSRKLYVNGLDKDIDKEKEIKNKKSIYREFAGDDEELYAALQEFESMRNRIKKPLTDGAKKRMLTTLQKYPRDQWIQLINQSVDHCWQSIYPLGDEKGERKTNNIFMEIMEEERG